MFVYIFYLFLKVLSHKSRIKFKVINRQNLKKNKEERCLGLVKGKGFCDLDCRIAFNKSKLLKTYKMNFRLKKVYFVKAWGCD